MSTLDAQTMALPAVKAFVRIAQSVGSDVFEIIEVEPGRWVARVGIYKEGEGTPPQHIHVVAVGDSADHAADAISSMLIFNLPCGFCKRDAIARPMWIATHPSPWCMWRRDGDTWIPTCEPGAIAAGRKRGKHAV